MKKTIIAKIIQMDNLTENEYGFKIEPYLVIRNMGKRNAGMASYFESTIYLNSLFLEEYPDSMIKYTLPHEYAHLLAFALHGINGLRRKRYFSHHGKEWKDCMRFLGVEPEIYHNYQLGKEKINGS